jgi:hypothetical protein
VNKEGNILNTNSAGVDLCGHPEASIVDIAEAGHKPMIQNMLQTTEVTKFQFRSYEPRHYSAWIIPDSETVHTVILNDETHLKQSLQNTEEKLKQRTDWLCQMSHEIRTTLVRYERISIDNQSPLLF